MFVDIDRIREHFTEMDEYRRRWAPTCGALTHKEAGYISELIWMAALENGQCDFFVFPDIGFYININSKS